MLSEIVRLSKVGVRTYYLISEAWWGWRIAFCHADSSSKKLDPMLDSTPVSLSLLPRSVAPSHSNRSLTENRPRKERQATADTMVPEKLDTNIHPLVRYVFYQIWEKGGRT